MTPEEFRANAKAGLEALSASKGEKGSPSKGDTPKATVKAKAPSMFDAFMTGLQAAFPQTRLATPAGLAAGAAGVDSLLLGNAGPILAGLQQGGVGPLGITKGLMNAASNVINPGKPMLNSDRQTSMIEDAQKGHPLAAAAGGVAGAVAPAIMAPEVGIPSLMGRLAAIPAIGAVEGGVSDRAKGGSGKEGAVIGGLLGAAGAVGSEVGVPIARWLKNSGPGKKAVDALTTAAKAYRGDTVFPTDRLTAELAKLGPGATIADLPELQGLAKSVLYDPKLLEPTSALAKTMSQRMDEVGNPGKTLQAEFEQNVAGLYPSFADRSGAIIGEPRSVRVVSDDIKAQKAALSPKFDEALDAVSTAQIKRPYLTDMANQVFKSVDSNGVPVSPTEGNKKALAYINRRLTELATDKETPEMIAAWKKGVSEARRAGVEAPPAPGFINPRDIQTLRLDLSPKISAALKAGDKHTAESLIAFKRGLTENILNEVPGYKGLNSQVRSEEDYLKATKLGQSVFSMKPEQLSDLHLDLMGLAEEGDKAGFAEGFFKSLTNELSTTAGTKKTISKVTDNDGFRAALELIMPGKGEAFAKQLETQIMLQNSANELMAGRGRAGAVAAGALDKASKHFAMGKIVGGAINFVTSKLGISSAAALGGVKELMPTGISPKTAAPLSDILNAGGEQAQGMLGSIGMGQVPPGLTKPSLMDSILQSRLSQNPLIWGAGGNIASGQRERADNR